MTKQQSIDTTPLVPGTPRADSDSKEGIKRLIEHMNTHVKCEKTGHHVPTMPTVDDEKSAHMELQEENRRMREEMEMVTAKLEYEMESRKNALYEMENLALQLRKTHSDLQSMTMLRNSLQASTKTLRRQKCYMVGLFEDLKHRHGELKQDFEFVSVQHNRTRAMLERALQEREYWETRSMRANPQLNNDDHPNKNSNEGPESLLVSSNNRNCVANAGEKRIRCDYESAHDQADNSIPIKATKQYRCGRQAFDVRGIRDQGVAYPAQEYNRAQQQVNFISK
ncbi:unnamed protein product [Cylindrotheca closterium]|uniref:Uncharacterized protein n=1 Tax=Cylindrotheca closterium TaxID=2856 RepID=A0AAD2CG88_9STRA|nr:unnamed protein product [Cylindrotheca closterium]